MTSADQQAIYVGERVYVAVVRRGTKLEVYVNGDLASEPFVEPPNDWTLEVWTPAKDIMLTSHPDEQAKT